MLEKTSELSKHTDLGLRPCEGSFKHGWGGAVKFLLLLALLEVSVRVKGYMIHVHQGAGVMFITRVQ